MLNELTTEQELHELSADEVDAVSGAVKPLLIWGGKKVVQCAASSTCRAAVRGTVIAGAAAVGIGVGYENNRE